MTNKNPYEIRLDVLQMAQNMLEAEQRSKEIKFREQVDAMRAAYKGSEEYVLSFIDANAPKAYTEEEVIRRSTTLYNFISNATNKK